MLPGMHFQSDKAREVCSQGSSRDPIYRKRGRCQFLTANSCDISSSNRFLGLAKVHVSELPTRKPAVQETQCTKDLLPFAIEDDKASSLYG